MRKLFKHSIEQPVKYIWLISFIYIFFYLIGILCGVFIGPPVEDINIGESKELFEIFKNNSLVAFSIITFGTLTGGLYSANVIFLNGYILGKLLYYLYYNKILYVVFRGLLPHAIIEIYCLCLISALSIVPIGVLFIYLKEEKKISFITLGKYLLILILVILGLFFSALLECYVSKIIL